MIRRRTDDSVELLLVIDAVQMSRPFATTDTIARVKERIMASLREQTRPAPRVGVEARERWVVIPAGLGLAAAVVAAVRLAEPRSVGPTAEPSGLVLAAGKITVDGVQTSEVAEGRDLVAVGNAWISVGTATRVALENGTVVRYDLVDGFPVIRFERGSATFASETGIRVAGGGWYALLATDAVVKFETVQGLLVITVLSGNVAVHIDDGSVIALAEGEQLAIPPVSDRGLGAEPAAPVAHGAGAADPAVESPPDSPEQAGGESGNAATPSDHPRGGNAEPASSAPDQPGAPPVGHPNANPAAGGQGESGSPSAGGEAPADLPESGAPGVSQRPGDPPGSGRPPGGSHPGRPNANEGQTQPWPLPHESSGAEPGSVAQAAGRPAAASLYAPGHAGDDEVGRQERASGEREIHGVAPPGPSANVSAGGNEAAKPIPPGPSASDDKPSGKGAAPSGPADARGAGDSGGRGDRGKPTQTPGAGSPVAPEEVPGRSEVEPAGGSGSTRGDAADGPGRHTGEGGHEGTDKPADGPRNSGEKASPPSDPAGEPVKPTASDVGDNPSGDLAGGRGAEKQPDAPPIPRSSESPFENPAGAAEAPAGPPELLGKIQPKSRAAQAGAQDPSGPEHPEKPAPNPKRPR